MKRLYTSTSRLPFLMSLNLMINLNLKNDYFLGDPEKIKKLMEAVANQGKKK